MPFFNIILMEMHIYDELERSKDSHRQTIYSTC
jgi:hypothetical protein